MKEIIRLAAVTTMIVLIAGCVEEESLTGPPDFSLARPVPQGEPAGLNFCGDPVVVPLIAGKGIETGSVTVTVQPGELHLDIASTGEWVLMETHAVVATALGDIPITRSGNPKIGQFPLVSSHDPPVTGHTYSVDLRSFRNLPGDLFIAVHASMGVELNAGGLMREVGAWADGETFPGRRRATWFRYFVKECVNAPECSLVVTGPVPGDEVCAEFPFLITWSADGDCDEPLVIDLLREGIVCGTIAESAPNIGEYEWIVESCGPETDGYQVRLTDPASGAAALSDGFFRIITCGGGE